METPKGLHPPLLAGWQFAETVRRELLETIRPLRPSQWTFQPGAGSWSVAEVVEHLLRAEIGSSKMLRKLIRGDYCAQGLPVGATLYTVDLDRYPFGRLEAPQHLVPGPPRDRGELERELAGTHARFQMELEGFRGDDPEALRSPDPATGIWFTLGGWVKVQAWHEAHHIAQIQGIITKPEFPR